MNKSIKEILESLKINIIENRKLIDDANEIDKKYNKKKIKIEEILKIIDFYKSVKSFSKKDDKIVIHKGNPYITMHICIQALVQNVNVYMVLEEFMLGTNNVLLKIINEVFKEYGVCNLIKWSDNFSKDLIDNIKNKYKSIVVIGDTVTYQILEDENNIKFYPFKNIFLYCDNEEFDELQEAIYVYANENEYEIEILCEKNIDEAIKIINLDDTKNIVILLTKENKERILEMIKGKAVYINQNPFKNEIGKIYNYLK